VIGRHKFSVGKNFEVEVNNDIFGKFSVGGKFFFEWKRAFKLLQNSVQYILPRVMRYLANRVMTVHRQLYGLNYFS
jgi:hypothetical protein